MLTDLATKQGALAYAERKRAEMVACWHERGRFEMNGFSYGAWVLGTHELDAPRKARALEDWKTGKKLPRAQATICRLPKDFHDMPGSNTMAGHTLQRELFSQALKRMAKLTKAVGVIFAGECWMAHPPLPPGSTQDQVQEWRDRQPADMGEIPGRFEALYMQLEHSEAGRHIWRAMIEREPDRVLPWKEGGDGNGSGEEARGRFVNLVDWRS